MDITYYGHSCFKVRGSQGSVVTDPFQASIGYTPPRVTANICTISHDHPGHNNAKVLRGDPYVITGPGEYEISGVFVFGLPSYHDRRKGRDRGRNTIYTFQIDGVNVCHLGDLGHVPDQATLEGMGDVDVLLIPVGGKVTLTAAMAAEVINLIEPRIVIPMHYATDAYRGEAKLAPVRKFLKEMGVHDGGREQDTLRLTASGLPGDTEVIVLKYRGEP